MTCGRKIGPYACCTVVQGDCLELMKALPDGCVDAVITDPPYGMNFRSNYRTVRYDAICGDSTLPLEAIGRCIRIPARFAYVFCRWDNLTDMPFPASVLAWVKNNWSMGDLKHEHGRQWEAICFYPKDGHEFVTRIPDVIHADRTGNVEHPTQKPVGLIKKLIESNVCETVIDPFLGSGTVAMAALECGKHFLGFEISEAYCKIARDRIAVVQNQPNLFERTTKLAEQARLYDGPDKSGALHGELDCMVELQMLQKKGIK